MAAPHIVVSTTRTGPGVRSRPRPSGGTFIIHAAPSLLPHRSGSGAAWYTKTNSSRTVISCSWTGAFIRDVRGTLHVRARV
eukprot:scaffold549_cov117-Isochrysis_galbana.AAC.5